MLDANDIQIISQIVTTALEKNNIAINEKIQDNNKEIHELIQDNNKEIHELIQDNNKEIHELIHRNNKAIRAEMMTIIESEVNPKLRLLAEGQEALLEKINRIDKQDELVGRVVVLEEAVKRLNRELSAIKQAQ